MCPGHSAAQQRWRAACRVAHWMALTMGSLTKPCRRWWNWTVWVGEVAVFLQDINVGWRKIEWEVYCLLESEKFIASLRVRSLLPPWEWELYCLLESEKFIASLRVRTLLPPWEWELYWVRSLLPPWEWEVYCLLESEKFIASLRVRTLLPPWEWELYCLLESEKFIEWEVYCLLESEKFIASLSWRICPVRLSPIQTSHMRRRTRQTHSLAHALACLQSLRHAHMHMHTHTHTHTNICIKKYMHTYTCMNRCMHTCTTHLHTVMHMYTQTHTPTHKKAYRDTCLCMYAWTQTYTRHMRTHTHTHTHMYTHTHTHHTHTHACTHMHTRICRHICMLCWFFQVFICRIVPHCDALLLQGFSDSCLFSFFSCVCHAGHKCICMDCRSSVAHFLFLFLFPTLWSEVPPNVLNV